MINKNIQTLLALMAVIISITVFPLSAYANTGGAENESANVSAPATTQAEVSPEETTQPTIEPEEPHEEPSNSSESTPLTPEGNLSLVDDVSEDASHEKQFVTVVSKNGNYFYLIIDRSADGKENVHFLNQVDEADLAALIEGGEFTPPTEPEIITPEPTLPQEPEEPTEPEVKDKNMGPAIIGIFILAIGGGIALYYFKIIAPKKAIKGNPSLDDFDFEDEEEFETEIIDLDKEDIE